MSTSIWNPDGVVNALGAREILQIACSDLSTALVITTDAGYFYVAQKSGFYLSGIEATLLTESSSGVVTVDINKNGVSILSTKLTIDANELTSLTAAVAAVLTTTVVEAGDKISIDIDTAGTGAKGLIVTLRGNYVNSQLD
jgi:hypothetical protein